MPVIVRPPERTRRCAAAPESATSGCKDGRWTDSIDGMGLLCHGLLPVLFLGRSSGRIYSSEMHRLLLVSLGSRTLLLPSKDMVPFWASTPSSDHAGTGMKHEGLVEVSTSGQTFLYMHKNTPASSSSPAIWKPAAGPGPPSPDASARWRGSTCTPKKNFSTIHPQCTCGVQGWTMNPTRQGWTATSSAPSWSRPDSGCQRKMHSSPCSPLTGYGCPKPPAPTSKRSASSVATGRW